MKPKTDFANRIPPSRSKADAQILIDPFLDKVLSANDEACAFFNQDLNALLSIRASDFFSGSLVSWIVFTEQVLEQNEARSNKLTLLRGMSHRTLVHLIAKKSNTNQSAIWLCFQDFESHDLAYALDKEDALLCLQHERKDPPQALHAEYSEAIFIGESSENRRVKQKIYMVASTDNSVLISGEQSSGKEHVARYIHALSPRSEHSFIKINCANAHTDTNAFNESFKRLLNVSEHSSETSAEAQSIRQQAGTPFSSSTFFLKHIDKLPLDLQHTLLRYLTYHVAQSTKNKGSHNPGIRFIASSTQDLKPLVKQLHFREDLHYALNNFSIALSPLRNRAEDIDALTHHFLSISSQKLGKTRLHISSEQMEKLSCYHWPGNILELRLVIERQALLANGGEIFIPDLSASLRPGNYTQSNLLTDREFKEREKLNIIGALKKSNGKVFGKGGAAEILDVKPTTLTSRIKKYNIDTLQYKHSEDLT